MMKRTALLAALALVSCNKGRVETTAYAPTGLLPRPSQVVVTDFLISPNAVKLDSGVGGILRRQMSGTGDAATAAQSAREAQQALTETLINQLTAYGLRVEHLQRGAVPPPNSLLVQGQFESVDQGNRTRRTLIGLGAGKSSVTADAQIYYVTNPASAQFLTSFNGSADSGRMPGAAETMGAGAAAQRLATSAALTAGSHALAEKYKTGDAANAVRLGEALASQIGNYAVGQGWTSGTLSQ